MVGGARTNFGGNRNSGNMSGSMSGSNSMPLGGNARPFIPLGAGGQSMTNTVAATLSAANGLSLRAGDSGDLGNLGLDNECIEVVKPHIPSLNAGKPLEETATLLCIKHTAVRPRSCLIQDMMGRWMCKEGMECGQ